jgi:UDP-N-acetyl-2-amino-2-deoxyglucuronate dehydrogenase
MCHELHIDYVVICTPNADHYSHIVRAVQAGCKVICEKPLCTNAMWAEKLLPYNERIFTILQMRLHPEAKRMKQELSTKPGQVGHLTYTTPRGQWYANSWKSNPDHGGLLLNIGVHCMDLLLHTFGPVKAMRTTPVKREATAMGFLHFENISMNYWLSTNAFSADRSIATLDNRYDFTNGFTDLHTESYREILAGRGFTVAEALPAIQLIDEIKKLQINPA